MVSSGTVKQQIIEQLDHLTEEQQKEVLAFTRELQDPLPPGIPGEELVERARKINFPAEDLAEIVQAIEEGCERIDWDEW